MKQYKIPLIYSSVMTFDVEAENLEDAITIAMKKFMEIPDSYYLEDSVEVDSIVDEYDENYSITTIMSKL